MGDAQMRPSHFALKARDHQSVHITPDDPRLAKSFNCSSDDEQNENHDSPQNRCGISIDEKISLVKMVYKKKQDIVSQAETIFFFVFVYTIVYK